MTDTSRPDDDTPALRDTVAALATRLDRIEARAEQPSVLDQAGARLSKAWSNLQSDPPDAQSAARSNGLLRPIFLVCAVLLAMILSLELLEEIFEASWDLGDWID